MTTPPFITLDGIDGVGKSTQIQRLAAFLNELGFETVCLRDPGSTPVGLRLREMLLQSDLDMHRRTEAMLFMASRCEMIEKTIRPALASGKAVISDRFLLANVVYQSIGEGCTATELWKLGRLAAGGLRPDLTLLLDMPASAALQRLDAAADRMEQRGESYLESVRQAFLRELPESSEQTAVIDASRPVEAVTHDVIDAVKAFLQSARSGSRADFR